MDSGNGCEPKIPPPCPPPQSRGKGSDNVTRVSARLTLPPALRGEGRVGGMCRQKPLTHPNRTRSLLPFAFPLFPPLGEIGTSVTTRTTGRKREFRQAQPARKKLIRGNIRRTFAQENIGNNPTNLSFTVSSGRPRAEGRRHQDERSRQAAGCRNEVVIMKRSRFFAVVALIALLIPAIGCGSRNRCCGPKPCAPPPATARDRRRCRLLRLRRWAAFEKIGNDRLFSDAALDHPSNVNGSAFPVDLLFFHPFR